MHQSNCETMDNLFVLRKIVSDKLNKVPDVSIPFTTLSEHHLTHQLKLVPESQNLNFLCRYQNDGNPYTSAFTEFPHNFSNRWKKECYLIWKQKEVKMMKNKIKNSLALAYELEDENLNKIVGEQKQVSFPNLTKKGLITCHVCKCYISDYLSHIFSHDHRQAARKCKFSKYIEQLCTKIQKRRKKEIKQKNELNKKKKIGKGCRKRMASTLESSIQSGNQGKQSLNTMDSAAFCSSKKLGQFSSFSLIAQSPKVL